MDASALQNSNEIITSHSNPELNAQVVPMSPIKLNIDPEEFTLETLQEFKKIQDVGPAMNTNIDRQSITQLTTPQGSGNVLKLHNPFTDLPPNSYSPQYTIGKSSETSGSAFSLEQEVGVDSKDVTESSGGPTRKLEFESVLERSSAEQSRMLAERRERNAREAMAEVQLGVRQNPAIPLPSHVVTHRDPQTLWEGAKQSSPIDVESDESSQYHQSHQDHSVAASNPSSSSPQFWFDKGRGEGGGERTPPPLIPLTPPAAPQVPQNPQLVSTPPPFSLDLNQEMFQELHQFNTPLSCQQRQMGRSSSLQIHSEPKSAPPMGLSKTQSQHHNSNNSANRVSGSVTPSSSAFWHPAPHHHNHHHPPHPHPPYQHLQTSDTTASCQEFTCRSCGVVNILQPGFSMAKCGRCGQLCVLLFPSSAPQSLASSAPLPGLNDSSLSSGMHRCESSPTQAGFSLQHLHNHPGGGGGGGGSSDVMTSIQPKREGMAGVDGPKEMRINPPNDDNDLSSAAVVELVEHQPSTTIHQPGGAVEEEGVRREEVQEEEEVVADKENSEVQLRGWLDKKGGSRGAVQGIDTSVSKVITGSGRRNWKRRYFIADRQAHKMYYFRDENDTHALGSVELLFSSVRSEQHGYMKNCFSIDSKGRGSLLLSAESEEETERWISFISKASTPRVDQG